jgi:predicted dehydrogenase
MHFVTDDPVVEVGAFYANRSGEAIDVEDTAALILKFGSGAIGTFHAGYTLAHAGAGYLNAIGYDSYLGINGSNGRIIWPDLNPRLQVELGTGPNRGMMRDENYPLPTSPAYGGVAGEEFFRRFFAAIDGKSAPPTTLDDAVRVARIVEAAAQSSESGRTVKLATT